METRQPCIELEATTIYKAYNIDKNNIVIKRHYVLEKKVQMYFQF